MGYAIRYGDGWVVRGGTDYTLYISNIAVFSLFANTCLLQLL